MQCVCVRHLPLFFFFLQKEKHLVLVYLCKQPSGIWLMVMFYKKPLKGSLRFHINTVAHSPHHWTTYSPWQPPWLPNIYVHTQYLLGAIQSVCNIHTALARCFGLPCRCVCNCACKWTCLHASPLCILEAWSKHYNSIFGVREDYSRFSWFPWRGPRTVLL